VIIKDLAAGAHFNFPHEKCGDQYILTDQTAGDAFVDGPSVDRRLAVRLSDGHGFHFHPGSTVYPLNKED
jgi:hypothetical protein